ncbi:rod-binding protein [Candidatus Magnetaquicoccus inordinatus]|uniref:rod-binding protein n=1 Tax=Candidatus Magnetaquicoccus inordinatus TaxID=2496818 RepID=UPI00102B2634|nr:rod-binding protein [Candidatus Magnetaquicoccus inordinatus]
MSDASRIGAGNAQLPMPANLTPKEARRLQAAASEFEALFIKQMLGSMRKTVPKALPGQEALLRESEGEKIFRDLLDGEYAKVMSQRKNGLGLKEGLLRYLANQNGRNRVDPQAAVARLQAQSSALNGVVQAPAGTGVVGSSE